MGALQNSLLRLLRPLVRLALKQGVTASQFSQLTRSVYVSVADEEFRLPGRKQSAARISVLTGLHRKEVARIQALLAEQTNDALWEAADRKHSRTERVVSSWVREADYLDEKGDPKPLPIEGAGSFSELVQRFGADVTYRSVLDELLRVGSVERVDDNTVRLLSRALVPQPGEEEAFFVFGSHGYDLLDTIEKNLATPEPADKLYQRRVLYNRVYIDDVPEFLAISRRLAQRLLEDLDRWLAAHRVPDDEQAESERIGLGIYQIQTDSEVPEDEQT